MNTKSALLIAAGLAISAFSSSAQSDDNPPPADAPRHDIRPEAPPRRPHLPPPDRDRDDRGPRRERGARDFHAPPEGPRDRFTAEDRHDGPPPPPRHHLRRE